TNTETFHANVQEMFANPSTLVFGRETADEAFARFNEGLAKVLRKASCENAVVVCHGTVISLFVARMTGTDPFPLWVRLGLPSFVVLEGPNYKLLDVACRIN